MDEKPIPLTDEQLLGLDAPPVDATHEVLEAPAQTPLKTAYTTGIHAITYPCGCQAKGPGNLPEHCPEHPAKKVEVFRDGHGNVFDPYLHAVNRDSGLPKTDSAGRLILLQHDYPGPPPNKNFGS